MRRPSLFVRVECATAPEPVVPDEMCACLRNGGSYHLLIAAKQRVQVHRNDVTGDNSALEVSVREPARAVVPTCFSTGSEVAVDDVGLGRPHAVVCVQARQGKVLDVRLRSRVCHVNCMPPSKSSGAVQAQLDAYQSNG